MMQGYWHGSPWMPFGVSGFGSFGFFAFSLLIAWSLAWKGMALWRAARRGEMAWFVVFLIVNTAGILEILYLYVFSKKGKNLES